MAIVETRDVALDGIKFFLICLVVIGHAIEPTRYTNPVSGWLYSAIYIFHMPLFIMLSGYFTKSVSSMERLNRQALKLLESYFLISIFIYLLVSRHYSVFIAPALSSWYILSLISWRYGYQLSSSIIDKCLPRNLAYGGVEYVFSFALVLLFHLWLLCFL